MDETFAQYRLRIVREERLQKEAIAAELLKKKIHKKIRTKEDRRLERERKRQLPPHVLELIDADKENALRILAAKAEKSIEVALRIESKLCVCCGDDRDMSVSKRHCLQCWEELVNGVIKPPGVSERQINSSMCRVVRKGTEMS
jgi:hypothetical protein